MRHFNLYTERYWMSFFEMILPIYTSGSGAIYQLNSSFYLDWAYSSFVQLSPQALSGGNIYYHMLNYSKSVTGNKQALITSNPHAEEVFQLIKERYVNEYVFDLSFDFAKSWPANVWKGYCNSDYYHIDWTTEQMNEFRTEVEKFVIKFYSVMEQTYERYATLLDFYANKKSQLLDKVESLTRFNDTPQDSGEFSDDEHTTHITSSKNDYDTLMARIDEVDRKYRNLLKDWSNEFECLFIHEESL